MEGKEKAEKLFSYAEYKHKQGEGDGSEKFYDRFMSCETVVAPSSLRWKNIQLSDCNRQTRTIIIWIIAWIIVIVAFYGMVRFKNFNDELKAGGALDTVCPKEPISASAAYDDYLKPGK